MPYTAALRRNWQSTNIKVRVDLQLLQKLKHLKNGPQLRAPCSWQMNAAFRRSRYLPSKKP